MAGRDILLVSPVVPDAAGDGRERRAFQWVVRLAGQGCVHLLVVAGPGYRARDRGAGEQLPVASAHRIDVAPSFGRTLASRILRAGGSAFVRAGGSADFVRAAGSAAFVRAAGSLSFVRAAGSRLLSALRSASAMRSPSLPRPAGSQPLPARATRGRLFWITLSPQNAAEVDRLATELPIGRVVCFRLYLADFALRAAVAAKASRVELDLDDVESQTWASIATRMRANDDLEAARRAELAAQQFREAEDESIARFDSVAVCSDDDREQLARRFPATEIVVLPNRILDPGVTGRVACSGGSPRALFVGSLDYYPNDDAVRFFAGEVLPSLRPDGWSFDVAGFGSAERLRREAGSMPGVRWLGAVADVGRCYADADVVVAPLRAGGGTKIKVIEALLRARPLVATAHAAGGLGLRDGEHYLAAETAEQFAAQCRRLAADGELAARLVERGRAFALERFALERGAVAGHGFAMERSAVAERTFAGGAADEPEPGGAPELSIVVCTHNGEATLARCLESLARQSLDVARYEVLVVDNGSTDGSARIAGEYASRYPNFRRIDEPRAGKSRAANAGLRACRAGVVAFADDDIEAPPDHAARIVAAFERVPRPHVVLGHVEPRYERAAPSWLAAWERADAARRISSGARDLGAGRDVYVAYGANFAFDRRALLDAGGFDESWGPVGGDMRCGGEDVEVVARLAARGCRVRYEPGLVVVHCEDTRATRLAYRARRLYLQGVMVSRLEETVLLSGRTARGVAELLRRNVPGGPSRAGSMALQGEGATARFAALVLRAAAIAGRLRGARFFG